MTQIRGKTMKMLEKLPDENMIYIFNILQNIEALSMSREMQEEETTNDAFATLMQ